jgi:hypothetical protein
VNAGAGPGVVSCVGPRRPGSAPEDDSHAHPFVGLNPRFEDAVERLTTFLARDDSY